MTFFRWVQVVAAVLDAGLGHHNQTMCVLDQKVSNLEVLWACGVMFVGTCAFGYIIGNGTIVALPAPFHTRVPISHLVVAI